MKISIMMLLLTIFSIQTAFAANTNFVPANESDGNYVLRKDRGATLQTINPTKRSEFWDKEYERSGFKQFGDKLKSVPIVSPFAKLGDFLKKQEEAYKERNMREM